LFGFNTSGGQLFAVLPLIPVLVRSPSSQRLQQPAVSLPPTPLPGQVSLDRGVEEDQKLRVVPGEAANLEAAIYQGTFEGLG